MSKELMGILERLQEKTYFRTIQGGDHRKEESLIEQAHSAIQEHYLGIMPSDNEIEKWIRDFLGKAVLNEMIHMEHYLAKSIHSEMERKIRGDV